MSKNVVLGVTGSIAAYKAAELASQLTKGGCEVHAVLTADAQHFISALPFKTLSRHPVVTDLYEEEQGWQPTHIKLAGRPAYFERDRLGPEDAIDLTHASGGVCAIAHPGSLGLADDALTCIALALNPQAKILVAPAMNGKMWLHPATQQNVAALKARGAEFIGPEEGLLSCGYEGLGRLWPVEKVAQRALEILG